MTEHEQEFTERKDIDVFVGTWNVNGKKVNEDLSPWLRPRGQGKRPDVYVIGFQEMVELNAQSVLLNQAMPGIESKSKDWQSKIERVINKGIPESSEDRFVPLESGFLAGKCKNPHTRESLFLFTLEDNTRTQPHEHRCHAVRVCNETT